MLEDRVNRNGDKQEVWEASGKPEVMDSSAPPLSDDFLKSASKIKNIFVVRKKSYNNSKFDPVDQDDAMGTPLEGFLNETGETSRRDPNSGIIGGPIFNLHNTRQALKFYPAVTNRTR